MLAAAKIRKYGWLNRQAKPVAQGAARCVENQVWPSGAGISPKPCSINLARASTAVSESGPLARNVSVVPFPAPSVNKSRMLLPLITSFPLTISTWQVKVAAIFTNKCAGRA